MNRDITSYIKELLFGHDCVIVPGFGAFIGNYSPAQIDHEDGLFYPPMKKVTFNKLLTNNDGLLIGHISAKEGIGYGEARDIINSFVEELKNSIDKGNKAALHNIGTFYKNREGMLIFEPDPDANYLLSAFGLASYHRAPVKDFDLRLKVLEHNDKAPVKIHSTRRMLTRAAVIIPLLVAMALIPFRNEIFKGKVQETNMNPLAVAELEYNRSQILNINPSSGDSTKGEAENSGTAVVPSEAAKNITQATQPVKPFKEMAVPVEEAESRYMIVTGSFKSEENALAMIRVLQAKGFTAVVGSGPDGFFRVSTGTFGTSAEANAALQGLKSSYPGAWICKSN